MAVVLFIAALMSSSIVQAQSYRPYGVTEEMAAFCEKNLKPTHIEVRAQTVPVRYDYSLPLSAINQEVPPNRPNSITLGFTRRNTSYSYRYSTPRFSFHNGWVCTRPSVEINLSLKKHEVYVTLEFPRGTCAHKEILVHEMTHVRINERHLEEVARLTRNGLRRHLGNAVYYGRGDVLQAQLKALLESWEPKIDQYFEDMRSRHAEFDDHEWTRSISNCPQERDQIMRAVQRLNPNLR